MNILIYHPPRSRSALSAAHHLYTSLSLQEVLDKRVEFRQTFHQDDPCWHIEPWPILVNHKLGLYAIGSQLAAKHHHFTEDPTQGD